MSKPQMRFYKSKCIDCEEFCYRGKGWEHYCKLHDKTVLAYDLSCKDFKIKQ